MPFVGLLCALSLSAFSSLAWAEDHAAHQMGDTDRSVWAFFTRLFRADFMPHGHCYFWRKDMILLHTLSDAGIALAYYSIPFLVLFFVKKRSDIPFQKVFYLFAAFIFLCGTTHLIDVVTLWLPIYRFDGVVKALTAGVSLFTAYALLPILPQALSLKSPAELEAKNRELELEVERRAMAEAALAEANRKLGAESEAALRQSRELMQTIIDNTSAYIYVKDEQGRFLVVNRALAADFPQFDTLIGKRDADLFPHDAAYAQTIRANDLTVMRSEQPHEFEETVPHPGGLRTFQSVKFSTALTPEKKGLCGISIEITEKRKAIQALNEKTLELERSNEDLARFAFVASHDLKEPLRAISNYAQLLEKQSSDKLDENSKLCVHYIVEGVRRMYVLIEDLLKYSKLGASRRTIDRICCEEVLQTALANLEASLRETGARVKAGPLPEIRGDRSELVQLFQNLIGNALKYRSKEAPQIEIQCVPRNGEWCFSVSDNGIGIPPEFHEKIFVLFQRLHSDDSGTGIGLAICKKIVERQGGRMWIESEVGKGSTFFFTAPLDLRQGNENTQIPSSSRRG